MNQLKFYSAKDVANMGGIPYLRVLEACQRGELHSQRIGPSFAIAEHDAQDFIAEYKRVNDPHNVALLQARIAELEAQLAERRAA